MRLRQLILALCLIGAFAPSASAQRAEPDIYARLERVADAGARIVDIYCGTRDAAFEGGIAGMNAMPERSNEPPLPVEGGIEGFAEAFEQVLNSGVEPSAIEKAAINGMIQIYDSLGSWMTPSDAHRPRDGGILIELDGRGATPIVVRAFDGGPAQLAGILPGDRVLEIDGEPTAGLELYEVMSRIRGAIGSDITMVVERAGAPLTLTMQRVRNARGGVYWRMQGDVAIITIEGFPENSANAVRDSIRSIRRAHPAGYIIDLRNNGGGLLDQVIEAADHFIDGGVVTRVRPYAECQAEEAATYNAHRRDETDGARLILLVNENTASGAEMMAAALRERRGAQLVGQTTFGNARIHTVIPMNGGRDGFLKLSTGVMTSPNSVTWDQTGLVPDHATAPRDAESDAPLDAAIALLTGAP